jgi:hypothetical protein
MKVKKLGQGRSDQHCQHSPEGQVQEHAFLNLDTTVGPNKQFQWSGKPAMFAQYKGKPWIVNTC